MSGDGKLAAQFAKFRVGRLDAAPHMRVAPPVNQTYCILITPRSGSTWLCHRIARLDRLGCPEEYFIANEFPKTLEFNPGRDIYEVFDIVAGKNRTQSGIFGFQISYFDLEEFEREASLAEVMLGQRYFFYLNRRNFVAQAISLYIAVESQIFHAYDGNRPPRYDVPYDEDKIRFWACHILQQEYGIQRWLATNGTRPVMLKYEELLEDIDGVIARIAKELGVDLSGAPEVSVPQTERITASRADAYERYFRSSHWEFCRKWEAVRGTAPCPYEGVAPMPAMAG